MATEAQRAPRVAHERTNLSAAGATLLARAEPPKAAVIPAFDPASPDTHILEAYERVRANKAWGYSFDGLPDHSMPQGEYDRRDEMQMADEGIVGGSFAATVPGVIAQLLLSIDTADQSRWIDRGLAEHGFLALYEHRRDMDGRATQIAETIFELLHIEWSQNLAAYEKAERDFSFAVQLKGLIESEEIKRRHARQAPDGFLQSLAEYSDEAERRFSNEREIAKLVRTLVPDHAAYLRKVEIIIAESFQEDATPWLVRDTNFLVGRIVRDDDATGGEA